MDCVRAQQLENWQNQRNIAQENRASGQGVVYGAPQQSGRFDAQEALTNGRAGDMEGVEMSQRALAQHLEVRVRVMVRVNPRAITLALTLTLTITLTRWLAYVQLQGR